MGRKNKPQGQRQQPRRQTADSRSGSSDASLPPTSGTPSPEGAAALPACSPPVPASPEPVEPAESPAADAVPREEPAAAAAAVSSESPSPAPPESASPAPLEEPPSPAAEVVPAAPQPQRDEEPPRPQIPVEPQPQPQPQPQPVVAVPASAGARRVVRPPGPATGRAPRPTRDSAAEQSALGRSEGAGSVGVAGDSSSSSSSAKPASRAGGLYARVSSWLWSGSSSSSSDSNSSNSSSSSSSSSSVGDAAREGGLHFTSDRIVFADFDVLELQGGRVPVLVVAYETLGLQVWRTDAPAGITLLYYYPGLAVRLARVLHLAAGAGDDAVLAYVPAGAESEVRFFSLTRGARYRCSAGGRRRGAPPFLDVRSSGRALLMATVHGLHVMDTAPVASLERVDTLACAFVPAACPFADRAPAFALAPRWLAYAAPDHARAAPARPGFVAPRADSVWAVSEMAATAVVRGLASGASLVSDAAVRWFGEQQPAAAAPGAGACSASESSSSAGASASSSAGAGAGGARAAGVPGDGSVAVYDVQTRQTLALFRAHEHPVAALAWDTSGLVLVSSDVRGHEFAVFRVRGAHVQCVYTLHRGITDGDIRSLAVSPDSDFVAAATSRGTVHVYPLAKGRAHDRYRALSAVGRFRHTLAAFAPSSSSSSSGSSSSFLAPPQPGGLLAYMSPAPDAQAPSRGAAPASPFAIVTGFSGTVAPARLLVATNAGALYVYAVCPDGNGVLERVCDIAPLPKEAEFWVSLPAAPAPAPAADPAQFLPAHVDLATGPPEQQPLWRDRRFAFAYFGGDEDAHPTETTPATVVEVARPPQPQPAPVAAARPARPAAQRQHAPPRPDPPQGAQRAAPRGPVVPAPRAAPAPAPVAAVPAAGEGPGDEQGGQGSVLSSVLRPFGAAS